MAHHQVVIVGAGPTGLLLAGDLAQAGIDVAILEKRDRQSNLTRAFAVHARTLEVLDMRGIADDLVALGNPAPRLRLTDRVAIDLSRLPSRFPFVLVTPQYHTEKVLRRRAIEAGAVIEPGHRVVSLTQDGDGVRLTVETADGHREETADWVVGTDGAHSTVRTSLDIAFDGELVAPARSWPTSDSTNHHPTRPRSTPTPPVSPSSRSSVTATTASCVAPTATIGPTRSR